MQSHFADLWTDIVDTHWMILNIRIYTIFIVWTLNRKKISKISIEQNCAIYINRTSIVEVLVLEL